MASNFIFKIRCIYRILDEIEIRPELSRQKQGIVLAGAMFLQKCFVHPPQPSDGTAFLRQLQIGDVVVSHQRIVDAVVMDFLW